MLNALEYYFNRGTRVSNKNFFEDTLSIMKKDSLVTFVGTALTYAIMTFIICHELSHYILGHVIMKGRSEVFGKNNDIDVGNYNLCKEQELDADFNGYKMFVGLLSDDESRFDVLLQKMFRHAPLVFFIILDLIDTYANNNGHVAPHNITHPDPEIRYNSLLEKADINPDDDESDFVNDFNLFSGIIKDFYYVNRNKESQY